MKPEKKRRGDRKDGWRIRSLNPFYQFTPFIMKTRNDASNLFEDFHCKLVVVGCKVGG